MVVDGYDNGLIDMLKQKYVDGIDREKMARNAVRDAIIQDMVDDGLLTVEQGIALVNGTPIKPRPWWVRVWQWVQGLLR